jgi:hypothetical protein
MTESVIGQETELKRKLQAVDAHHRIENIEFCMYVTDFLKPLQQATKALEEDKYPTIHRFILWNHRLMQHVHPLLSDIPAVKQLKLRLANALPRK